MRLANMPPFKVLERVRCIRSDGVLIDRGEYTVNSCYLLRQDIWMITVREDVFIYQPNRGWYATRFERVEE